MTQGLDLAVQYGFEPLKHSLNAPACAIQPGDLGCADLGREIAPQKYLGVAIGGVCVETYLDAPPRLLTFLHDDGLLVHLARVDPTPSAPRLSADHPRML